MRRAALSFSSVAAARVFFGLGQWAIVALTGRLAGVEDLGRLGLALGITTPLAMLLGLSLRTGVATDVGGTFPVRAYQTVRGISSLLIVLGSAAVAWIFFQDPVLVGVICAVAIPKAIEGASELSYGFAQRQGSVTVIGVSYILRTILGVGAFGIALHLTGSLIFAVLAWGLAWLVIFLAYDKRTDRPETESLEQKNTSLGRAGLRLVIAQVPLALGGFLGNLALSLPRFVLQDRSTLEVVGVFTALFFVYQAGNMIIQTLGQMASPTLARAFQSGRRRQVVRRFGLLAGLFLILSCAGLGVVALFGQPILTLAYGADFAGYESLFLLMGVSWSVRYVATAGKVAIAARRKFTVSLLVDAMAFAAALVIYLAAIPSPGTLVSGVNAFLVAQFAYAVVVFSALGVLLARIRDDSAKPDGSGPN